MNNKPKPIRCLAIDLDGTLIGRSFFKPFISKDNIDAIKEYCSGNENKVVISTGKCFFETWKVFKQLEEQGLSSNEIPFFVCRNGASIWSTNIPPKPIMNIFFDEEFCKKILEILNREKIDYFFINSKGYVFSSPSLLSFFVYKFFFKSKTHGRILRNVFPLNEIQKILIFFKWKNPFVIKKMFDEELGENNYCFSRCCRFCWEIIDFKIDKYYGLQKIAPKLGLEEFEMGAIGNEKNDFRSLKSLGVGIYLNWRYDSESKPSSRQIFIKDRDGTGVAKGILEMKDRGFWQT